MGQKRGGGRRAIGATPEDTIQASFSVTKDLRQDFAEKCAAVGGNLASFFIRVFMAVVVEMPLRTLVFLHQASRGNHAQAGQLALGWMMAGYDLDQSGAQPGTTGGSALAAEGGQDMPDPEAREQLRKLEERFDAKDAEDRSFKDQVLGALRQIGVLDAEERPTAPQRKARRKK